MIDLAQRPEYLQWANARLGSTMNLHEVRTLTSVDQNGSILGVVVFSRFTPGGCEVTVVGDKGWLQRRLVLTALAYVFTQCGFRRVTAFVAVENSASLKLAQQLGFRHEGLVRKWFPDSDAYVLGLLPEDCKFLKERTNGRRRKRTPTT